MSLFVLLSALGALAAGPAEAAAAVAPGPDRMQRATMTPSAMLRLAEIAQDKGDDAVAEAIYRALENDPDADIRTEARFRRARQLLSRQRTAEAAQLLRTVVDSRPDATAARLELAYALNLLDRPDDALRELRAAQSAGLPSGVAALVDRYSLALRARRPWGMSLEVAIAPSSNINRATRLDRLGTIFGDFAIDADGKAKSGIGLALNGQAYRRLSLGDRDAALLLRSTGRADLYRQSEFNDIALDLAAGPEFALGDSRFSLEAGLTQRWFGQRPFLRMARIGATATVPVGRRTQFRVSGNAALLDNRFNNLQDGRDYGARIAAERSLTPTLGVGAHLSLDRMALKDKGYSSTSCRAGLIGWKQMARTSITVEAEIGRLRADERLTLFRDRRSDRFARLALAATLRQLEWQGFAPVARFSIERNRSTIAFYDYRRTRTELGIVRAF